ncbi:MAG: DUF4097 family beta strand repeat-containing protein [Actinomycetota bacterium]
MLGQLRHSRPGGGGRARHRQHRRRDHRGPAHRGHGAGRVRRRAASGLASRTQIDDQTGDVTLAGLSSPELTVQSGAGDITGTGLAVGGITARDDAGDITLSFARVPSRVQVICLAGDVTLVMPAGSTAYRVEALDSAGSVTVGVPTSPSATHLISVTDSAGMSPSAISWRTAAQPASAVKTGR